MRRSLVVVALLVVAGCQDQGPRLREGGGLPQFGHLQNSPLFGFKAPVPPGTTLPTGEFHGYAAPEVSICLETTDGCTPVLVTATLTTTTQSGSSTLELVEVDHEKEEYKTEWKGLNPLRNASPDAIYRIKVRAAPLLGGSLQFMGQTRVTLGTSTSSDVVAVSGNSLPIKFLILIGAFCDEDCTELIMTGASQTPVGDDGGYFLGINILDDDFIDCTDAGLDCPSEVYLYVSRYRGPDRCILFEDEDINSLQWEACVTARSVPHGVRFRPNTVFVELCIDPAAESYVSSGHGRMLKMSEDEDGNPLRDQVVDLNATLTAGFFDCGSDWEPESLDLGASAPGDDMFSRLAARTASILRPMAVMLAPRPLHAKRRTGLKTSGGITSWSRIGLAMALEADFGPSTIVGLENTLLPDASQPWARVRGTSFPDFCETHPNPQLCTPAVYPANFGYRGVHDVRVEFEVPPINGGGGSVGLGGVQQVLTNGNGYAKASWTLGPASGNPQRLAARVGYPAPFIIYACPPGVVCEFANPETPWAEHEFTATALGYAVFFLSPLGTGGATGPNVTDIAPRVRVCGPLADPANATATPGQTCGGNVHTLPNPVLKSGAWETAWKSDKETVTNSLYRIDVYFGNAGDGSQPAIGSVLARRGGGGGGIDPIGTYQFQNGANIPVKFVLNELLNP
jgi:hypothetical protein